MVDGEHMEAVRFQERIHPKLIVAQLMHRVGLQNHWLHRICARCLVQLSYAIGVAKPLSVYVDTYGTNKVSMNEIYSKIDSNFDLRPGLIRKELQLRRPIYNKTAAYGHFGRSDNDFLWEKPKRM